MSTTTINTNNIMDTKANISTVTGTSCSSDTNASCSSVTAVTAGNVGTSTCDVNHGKFPCSEKKRKREDCDGQFCIASVMGSSKGFLKGSSNGSSGCSSDTNGSCSSVTSCSVNHVDSSFDQEDFPSSEKKRKLEDCDGKSCIDLTSDSEDSEDSDDDSDDDSEDSGFCETIICDRTRAKCEGEMGGFVCEDREYFYFRPKDDNFSEEQIKEIKENIYCFYFTGKACKNNQCECLSLQADGTLEIVMGVGRKTAERESKLGLLSVDGEDDHEHMYHIGIPAPDQAEYMWHKGKVQGQVSHLDFDEEMGGFMYGCWKNGEITDDEVYFCVRERCIEKAIVSLKSIGLEIVYEDGGDCVSDYTIRPIDENDERYTIQHRIYLDKEYCEDLYVDINKVRTHEMLQSIEWSKCDEGYYCVIGMKELRKKEKEFEQHGFYLNEWNETVPSRESTLICHDYDFILQPPDDERFAPISRAYIDKDFYDYNDLDVDDVVKKIKRCNHNGWIKCDEGFYKKLYKGEKFPGFKLTKWNETVDDKCPERVFDFLVEPEDYREYEN